MSERKKFHCQLFLAQCHNICNICEALAVFKREYQYVILVGLIESIDCDTCPYKAVRVEQ